MFGLISS